MLRTIVDDARDLKNSFFYIVHTLRALPGAVVDALLDGEG